MRPLVIHVHHTKLQVSKSNYCPYGHRGTEVFGVHHVAVSVTELGTLPGLHTFAYLNLFPSALSVQTRLAVGAAAVVVWAISHSWNCEGYVGVPVKTEVLWACVTTTRKSHSIFHCAVPTRELRVSLSTGTSLSSCAITFTCQDLFD